MVNVLLKAINGVLSETAFIFHSLERTNVCPQRLHLVTSAFNIVTFSSGANEYRPSASIMII